MTVPVQFLMMMMMMMMKSEGASAEIITVQSGETVVLPPDQLNVTMEQGYDVRWTHLHLMVSLNTNVTKCEHRRCELLRNGSLRFSRVQTEDSGNYSLQMFDQGGTRLMKRDFLLRVKERQQTHSTSLFICCLLLLLLPLILIIVFILRRRRIQRRRTAGPMEENVHVTIYGYHGNMSDDGGDEEEEQERGEEPAHVPCDPAVSMETPITQQTSVEAENDIYV